MTSTYQSACHNRSLVRLGGILQVMVSRRVVLESSAEFEHILSEWESACKLLIGDSAIHSDTLKSLIAPSINSTVKATLLYVSNIASKGEAKFSFITSRDRTLEDGLHAAEKAGVLHNARCIPQKFFPKFFSEGTGVEHGEGH